MTVSRFLVLIAIALSPLSAWGQVTPPLRPDPLSRNGGQFASESNTNPRSSSPSGLNAGANPPSPTGYGQQPEVSSGLQPLARPHYTAPIWQTTERGGFFGMMGAVAQPGVYYHQQERVALSEILKLAGGATAEASGGVRIVRQGRGGLQTFLSPDSRYELLNGDVVLLESHRRPSQPGLRQFSRTMQTAESGEQRGAASRDTATKKGLNTPAYLAFVNLRPEPIIVPVPSDQATLTAVMAWLRQDSKSPPFVRVVSSSPLLRRDNSLPADQQLLESGTVLVFDSATVKHDRLPEFPPVIGFSNAPPTEPAPAAPAKPPSSSQPAIPSNQPPMPQIERPAVRAMRSVLPLKAPVPSSQPKLVPVPRRGLGQQTTSENNEPRSSSSMGGPVLLMPQNRGNGNPQATGPDYKSRPATLPKEIDEERPLETTAASFEGQQLAWQSRPSEGGEDAVVQEFEDEGVVQAHREQGLADPDVEIGPALELPRPIPNSLPAPALIPPPSSPSDGTSISRSLWATFTSRIVWFSLSGILMLTGILWWLSRWDQPHFLHVRAIAGRKGVTAPDRPAPGPRRSVLLAERLPIRRTDTRLPQVDSSSTPAPTSPETGEVSGGSPAALPPPLRTISPREHALRAHFRQARLERGKRVVAEPPGDDLPEPSPAVSPEATTPAPEPVVRAPNFPTIKSSDVLGRALHVKRGKMAAEEDL